MQFKRNLSSCTKQERKWKGRLINAVIINLFLLQLSSACNPAFYFNMGKKLWARWSFFSVCFCYYCRHPNNNNKIFPLPSSVYYQQHFPDWFKYLGTIQIWWNLSRNHYCLSSAKSVICQKDANCSLFQSLNCWNA